MAWRACIYRGIGWTGLLTLLFLFLLSRSGYLSLHAILMNTKCLLSFGAGKGSSRIDRARFVFGSALR